MLFRSNFLVSHILILQRFYKTALIICEMSSNISLSRVHLGTNDLRQLSHVWTRTFTKVVVL